MIADGLNTGIPAAADSVPREYGDGKYRWVAELPMLKSFFLLFEVWKVLGIGALAVALLGAAVSLIGGNGPAGAAGSAGMAALVLGILLVLSVPSYWIVTRANNGKYTVLFEMDGAGISHTQIKTDKARALEALTTLAGAAAKSRPTTAAGILSASGGSLYSRFSKVKRIRAVPEKNLILLSGTLIRNQVYTDPQYFDFVYEFITRRCPGAKIG